MIKFNFYYSLLFWGAFLLVALSSRIFDQNRNVRPYFFLVTSSLMILAVPQFSIKAYFAVVALSFFSFLIGYVLSTKSLVLNPLSRKGVALLGILGILVFLAFFKYHFLQDFFMGGQQSAPPAYLFLIGVSYFSFKMIHFVVESYRRKIENPDLRYYLNYILFFPSFISGPINRYAHFSVQLASPPKTSFSKDIVIGSERIIHGLFKKFVLVQLLYPHILGQQAKPLTQISFGEIIVGLYAYALYFYFDFSAYSDLAIGGARILGFELPENFNRPFLKKNIRELWMNWHISLTGWLVDYIYWPLVRKLRGLDFFRPRPVLLSNVGMIVTFIACGIWHGETLNFVIWGAYHGLGISIVNIYQREKRKVSSPILQRYFRSRVSAVLGTFLTFNFFTWGLLFFAYDFSNLKILISRVLSKG
jgi:alginate O-acetyltransferase complex protein AlgI